MTDQCRLCSHQRADHIGPNRECAACTGIHVFESVPTDHDLTPETTLAEILNRFDPDGYPWTTVQTADILAALAERGYRPESEDVRQALNDVAWAYHSEQQHPDAQNMCPEPRCQQAQKALRGKGA